jgi:hypothetical protein
MRTHAIRICHYLPVANRSRRVVRCVQLSTALLFGGLACADGAPLDAVAVTTTTTPTTIATTVTSAAQTAERFRMDQDVAAELWARMDAWAAEPANPSLTVNKVEFQQASDGTVALIVIIGDLLATTDITTDDPDLVVYGLHLGPVDMLAAALRDTEADRGWDDITEIADDFIIPIADGERSVIDLTPAFVRSVVDLDPGRVRNELYDLVEAAGDDIRFFRFAW